MSFRRDEGADIVIERVRNAERLKIIGDDKAAAERKHFE